MCCLPTHLNARQPQDPQQRLLEQKMLALRERIAAREAAATVCVCVCVCVCVSACCVLSLDFTCV